MGGKGIISTLLDFASGVACGWGAVRCRTHAPPGRLVVRPSVYYWTIVTTVWSISLAVVITFELAW